MKVNSLFMRFSLFVHHFPAGAELYLSEAVFSRQAEGALTPSTLRTILDGI
jgi:hypothetical protein